MKKGDLPQEYNLKDKVFEPWPVPKAKNEFGTGSLFPFSATDENFWRSLEQLFTWKRKNMALLDMPQGAEVLIWLLRNAANARPLKDLYRRSRFSEPTIRALLKALVEEGLILIDRNPDDMRVRTVRLTQKLNDTVQEYFSLLRECTRPKGNASSHKGGHKNEPPC